MKVYKYIGGGGGVKTNIQWLVIPRVDYSTCTVHRLRLLDYIQMIQCTGQREQCRTFMNQFCQMT